MDRTEWNGGPQARIRVRDNRSGIAPAFLPRLFAFGATTKPRGHGIGLWGCRRLLEDHYGGALTVESALGEGSAFSVFLPCDPD